MSGSSLSSRSLELSVDSHVSDVVDFLHRYGFESLAPKFEYLKIDGSTVQTCLQSFANLLSIVGDIATAQKLFIFLSSKFEFESQFWDNLLLQSEMEMKSTIDDKRTISQQSQIQICNSPKMKTEKHISNRHNCDIKIENNHNPMSQPPKLEILPTSVSHACLGDDCRCSNRSYSSSSGNSIQSGSVDDIDCKEENSRVSMIKIENIDVSVPLSEPKWNCDIDSKSTNSVNKKSISNRIPIIKTERIDIKTERIDIDIETNHKWTHLHIRKLRKYVSKYGCNQKWNKIAKRMRKYQIWSNANVCKAKWKEINSKSLKSVVNKSGDGIDDHLYTFAYSNRRKTTKKRFKCEICTAAFSTKLGILAHFHRHNNSFPFRCEYCNKGFVERSAKKRHIRTHTGEKPFECSECGMRFGENSNLKRHTKIHLGIKDFKCQYSDCRKTFRESTNLLRHVQRCHTFEKNCNCDMCGAVFVTPAEVQLHRTRSHTNPKKKFNCHICNQNFKGRYNLKIHHTNQHNLT